MMSTLQIAKEIEKTRREIKLLDRGGELDPRSGQARQMETARAKLAKMHLPNQAETAAAFEAELNQAHGEWLKLHDELTAATKAELTATIELKTAQVRHNFAHYRPGLSGLNEVETLREQVNATAAHSAAIQRRVTIEARRAFLESIAQDFYGCHLGQPSTWPAAIARRIEALHSDEIQATKAGTILAHLGLSSVDELRNLLA